MRRLSRRELLGGSTALVALSAGCLNDGGLIGDGEEPAGSDGGAETGVLTSIETADGLESAGYVRYSHPQPSEETTADLFVDADEADAWIESSPIDPEGDAATVLRETDYETARAVVVEAQAPDGCHALAVDDVSLDDGAISVSARLRADDDADVCTQAISAEGIVVRVTTADDPPNELSVSVTMPDGSTHGMGVATDSNSASTNGSNDGS